MGSIGTPTPRSATGALRMKAATRRAMHKLSLLLALATFGCTAGDSGPPYDLHVVQRLAPASADLHVGVVQASGNATLIGNEWTPVGGSRVDETYVGLLAQGVAYDVYLFEDLDGNGNCSASDRAWRQRIDSATGEVTIDLDRMALDPTACAYFTSP
jgi:hypothetical protein